MRPFLMLISRLLPALLSFVFVANCAVAARSELTSETLTVTQLEPRFEDAWKDARAASLTPEAEPWDARLHASTDPLDILFTRLAGRLSNESWQPTLEDVPAIADAEIALLNTRAIARSKWGVEALAWESRANPALPVDQAAYFTFLFDQFLPDDVSGNAFGASRILYAGLRVWPEAVMQGAHDRWLATPRSAPLDQEGIYLATLLLCGAAGNDDASAQWVHDNDEDETLFRTSTLSFRNWTLLQRAAALILATPENAEHQVLLDEIARPLARAFIRQDRSATVSVLAEAAACPMLQPIDADAILQGLINLDAPVLHEDRFRRMMLEACTYRTYDYYYADNAIAQLYDEYQSEEDDYWRPEPRTDPVPSRLLAAMVEEMPTISKHLLEDSDSPDFIEEVRIFCCLSRLGGKKPWADFARRLLRNAEGGGRYGGWTAAGILAGFPEESYDAIRPLLDAAVERAAATNNVEMMRLLGMSIMPGDAPDWSPLDSEAFTRALLKNLENDDVEQNGADAYAVFFQYKEDLEPLAKGLKTEKWEDSQVRRAARNLLMEHSTLDGI